MKTTALLMIAAFLACTELALAQSAAPMDAAAAKAALNQPVKKSRFTPKSAVKSRTYTLNAKGAAVEILEYELAAPGAEPIREERPYVAIPILFVVGKDELLDEVSRENVRKTATILREIISADSTAKFTIQGHTSAEGSAEENLALSDKRAKKVFALLTATYQVLGAQLNPVGFGEAHAVAPETAPAVELQQDRRVLIVRQ